MLTITHGAEGCAKGVQKRKGTEPGDLAVGILVFSWKFLSLGGLHSHYSSALQAGPSDVHPDHFAG